MNIKATINVINSKTEIIDTSEKNLNTRNNNNQFFSYGPFLSISTGNISNINIKTNTTAIINCHSK